MAFPALYSMDWDEEIENSSEHLILKEILTPKAGKGKRAEGIQVMLWTMRITGLGKGLSGAALASYGDTWGPNTESIKISILFSRPESPLCTSYLWKRQCARVHCNLWCSVLNSSEHWHTWYLCISHISNFLFPSYTAEGWTLSIMHSWQVEPDCGTKGPYNTFAIPKSNVKHIIYNSTKHQSRN